MIYKALANEDLNLLLEEVNLANKDGFRLQSVMQEFLAPMSGLKTMSAFSYYRWVAILYKYEKTDLDEIWGQYVEEKNLDK